MFLEDLTLLVTISRRLNENRIWKREELHVWTVLMKKWRMETEEDERACDSGVYRAENPKNSKRSIVTKSLQSSCLALTLSIQRFLMRKWEWVAPILCVPPQVSLMTRSLHSYVDHRSSHPRIGFSVYFYHPLMTFMRNECLDATLAKVSSDNHPTSFRPLQ